METNIEHPTSNAEHRMKTLTVCAHELVTVPYPMTAVLQKLMDEGAPVKWKTHAPLLQDATAKDVEFVGEIFRATDAIGNTEYSWNTGE